MRNMNIDKMRDGVEISLIIPLYKGKKYIMSIISMLNDVQFHYGNEIEVIFVNDYPQESIQRKDCMAENNEIKTILIQNEQNIGIQQSRITGIRKSVGKYIIMLDQDDEISPYYIKSQLNAIKDADAVVCNAIHFNRVFYDSEASQDRIMVEDTYLYSNPIISPGQVMIKKDAIPAQWMENPLFGNGSDDYYLWILMLHEKKKITVNREVLYLHHISGGNFSYNVDQMEKSIDEMIGKLKAQKVWSEEQCDNRKKALLTDDREKLIRDSLNMMIMKEWLYLKQINRPILGFFHDRNIKQIAVYGYGILGTFLEIELRGSDIRIEYFIDRNMDCGINVPVIRFEELGLQYDKVDCIVVCVVYEYEKIKESILAIDPGITIVSLLEILGNVVTRFDQYSWERGERIEG